MYNNHQKSYLFQFSQGSINLTHGMHKALFIITILLVVLLLIGIPTKAKSISQQDFQHFFNHTLDSNCDGRAILHVDGAGAESILDSIEDIFQYLDKDNDHHVSIEEVAGVELDPWKQGHQQLHLSFTENDDEMQVMWVSNPETYLRPYIIYGKYPTQLNSKGYATTSTYDVGHIGFQGKIYRGVMRELEANTVYYYRVGDEHSRTYSRIKKFRAKPRQGEQLKRIRFATMGDVGTFAPFGYMTLGQIARDNLEDPFDFVWLTGDIAYAGMNSQQEGEIEPIWDLFGQLSEPFAAYTPFMAGVGNHQKYYNYSAYSTRFRLPKKYHDQPNFWFSFDYGQLHVTYFSSEEPYGKGSEQYLFLEEDLRQARSNPNTKWIFVGSHRPFYSCNSRSFSNDTDLARSLEELLRKYKVDIVQNGHIHSYQRTWPVFRGATFKEGQSEDKFENPQAPIYVVQGTGGALMYKDWVDPIPDWSIRRLIKYGYGEVIIEGSTLRYHFIDAMTGKLLDSWTLSKP